ncbi:NodB homology domain-containing protein [Plasmodiophora brassicae]|nr:hypothetical protein PBRA_008990 [Plasmodiophora brassicae]
MSTFQVVTPGVYAVSAPNHDSYVRFTMPTGCYNLAAYKYMRLRAWASPGTQFTIDLKQGFPDCRLDLWPYAFAAGSALASHYTANGAFDGSAGGQIVYVPLADFQIDLAQVCQVFVSSFYTLPVQGPVTSARFGDIEFTNDPPASPMPAALVQNPTATSCDEPYTFAVTFDNQYSGNLMKILDDLASVNAKCTIFQIGGELVENDLAMKRALAEGHQVAAHTWTHPDLLELDEASIRREMLLTDDALVQRLGVRTRWFRPPFGHQDPRVRAILDSMGYVSINWDIDSTDYFNQNNGELVWSRIKARLDHMDPARAGAILLLHNDIEASANLVIRTVEYARSKGFTKFVTVEECMRGKHNSYLGLNPSPTPAQVPAATPAVIRAPAPGPTPPSAAMPPYLSPKPSTATLAGDASTAANQPGNPYYKPRQQPMQSDTAVSGSPERLALIGTALIGAVAFIVMARLQM